MSNAKANAISNINKAIHDLKVNVVIETSESIRQDLAITYLYTALGMLDGTKEIAANE